MAELFTQERARAWLRKNNLNAHEASPHACIGKKSSMHIASSPGEQRKISGR